MIKNIIYCITGIYISQEYKTIIPNVKDHINYITPIILDQLNSNNQLIKNKNLTYKCPVLNFIFKK